MLTTNRFCERRLVDLIESLGPVYAASTRTREHTDQIAPEFDAALEQLETAVARVRTLLATPALWPNAEETHDG